MREITFEEVKNLESCLHELAAHHNQVSRFFKGQYPKRKVSETLASFERDMISGRSKIAVIESGGRVYGFCKINISGSDGEIDHLIVSKDMRGGGYGKAFVDWALDIFRQNAVRRIEVKVVDGNDAEGFYEKCGFKTSSHILRMDLKDI